MHLIVLLIDERPEEVTEMRRNVHGEVIASSMDRDVESHVRTSQLIMERAKRISESGRDVFVLLDSITRTARAFNKWVGNTGRTMSGGLDVKAMDIPKKMFGTARRFDEGGSLTVAATALIDTGSRMDEVIFQEFKGTGNMEMVLSRDLADRRIWPSIDITLSGTRREEKILPPEVLESIVMLRRSLVAMSPVEAMEQLIKRCSGSPPTPTSWPRSNGPLTALDSGRIRHWPDWILAGVNTAPVGYAGLSAVGVAPRLIASAGPLGNYGTRNHGTQTVYGTGQAPYMPQGATYSTFWYSGCRCIVGR